MYVDLSVFGSAAEAAAEDDAKGPSAAAARTVSASGPSPSTRSAVPATSLPGAQPHTNSSRRKSRGRPKSRGRSVAFAGGVEGGTDSVTVGAALPEFTIDSTDTAGAGTVEGKQRASDNGAGAEAASSSSRSTSAAPTSVGLLGVGGASKARPKSKTGGTKARPRSRPTKSKPKAKQKKIPSSGGRSKAAKKGSVSVADV